MTIDLISQMGTLRHGGGSGFSSARVWGTEPQPGIGVGTGISTGTLPLARPPLSESAGSPCCVLCIRPVSPGRQEPLPPAGPGAGPHTVGTQCSLSKGSRGVKVVISLSQEVHRVL